MNVRTDVAGERVLVIGDDMRIFLGVVRSYGRAGLEVHAAPFDPQAPALRSKYLSGVHRLPPYSDDPSHWVRSILDLLRGGEFDLVVPTCDRAILTLHAHRDELAGYRLAIPGPVAMDLLFDKERTRELCGRLGIPVVPGRRLSAGDTAAEIVAELGLPLVLKPRQSYFLDRLESWGKVWIVEGEDELRRLLAEVQEPSRYLVEGFFRGVGVGVSVLAKDGRILRAFQHRRLREGRGGSSSYRISEALNPELLAACTKICAHTDLTGVCMFEFRYDPAGGGFVLLETNARFWGSLQLPLSLGLDFPRELYELLVHGREPVATSYPAGVTSRNLFLDGRNLLSQAMAVRADTLRPWLKDLGDFALQPLRWAAGRERSDTFVLDDLRPAFAECAHLAGRALRILRPKRNAILTGRRSGPRLAR